MRLGMVATETTSRLQGRIFDADATASRETWYCVSVASAATMTRCASTDASRCVLHSAPSPAPGRLADSASTRRADAIASALGDVTSEEAGPYSASSAWR